jgi:hypothetical protein
MDRAALGDAPQATVWLCAEQIAGPEGTTPRYARRKYVTRARACGGVTSSYARLIPSNGGYKWQFNLSLLDEETQNKFLATAHAAVPVPAESPAETASTSGTLERITPAPTSIVRSESLSELLPFESDNEAAGTSAIPKDKLAWARARRKAVLLLTDEADPPWENLRGQSPHGILISTKEDIAKALAADSRAPDPALAPWPEINRELRQATNDPRASISPISVRSIWRLYGWYTAGRPLLRCAKCGGGVNQHSGNCEHCDSRQSLPPGLEALQPLDRSDKGRIRLNPIHKDWLCSLFLSGDRTVRKARLALQRPRSAKDCYERLKLEVEVAGGLPIPAPSYYRVRRFYREEVPAILRKIAVDGPQSGWLKHKPYIPFLHPNAQVNDFWYADFRSTNVSTWITTDDKLYRIYCCAIMDHASRDVVACYDFHPSAQLFKSTLRLAVLTWGVPRNFYLDNGKEFTCLEILGGNKREWRQRVSVDEECKSIFTKLGIAVHFCIPKNPTGKAPLERFFERFDKIERDLPGWTGEKANDGKRTYGRKDRWKKEVKEHRLFCDNALPETPLWTADQLVQYETRWLASDYRVLTKLGAEGLKGRTPQQIQEAFKGVRQKPNPAALDLLLWYRRTVCARADKISVDYHGRTLLFRADGLLALAGDCEVEVHVDPLNTQRAVALDPLGKLPPIILHPCEYRERSASELAREIERQQSLRKAVVGGTLLASRLAPVRGPEEYLALIEQAARTKQSSLRAASLNPAHEILELPEYAAANRALSEASEVPTFNPQEEPVFTSRVESEEWQKAKQKGL